MLCYSVLCCLVFSCVLLCSLVFSCVVMSRYSVGSPEKLKDLQKEAQGWLAMARRVLAQHAMAIVLTIALICSSPCPSGHLG